MNRFFILFLFLSLLLLASCAPNYIKIIKLDASGRYIPFASATADGCVVVLKGDLNGLDVRYDDKCSVEFKGL